MFRNLKLRTQFTIFILLVTLPLLSGSLFFLNNRASETINQQASRALRDANYAIEINANTWLEQQYRALQQTANLPNIVSMDPTLQQEALIAMAQAHPNLYLLHTLDMTGFNVSRSDDAALKDYSDRKYFKNIISGEPISYQVVIGKTSGQPALVLAIPILDENSHIIGVASSAGKLDDISKSVTGAALGETGIAFIVDSNNQIIAHTDPTYTTGELQDFSKYPPVTALRQGQEGLINFSDENNVSWRAYVSQIDNGWGIIIQQTEEELLAPIRAFHTFTLFITILGLSLLALFSIFAIQRAVAPIKIATETAILIADGNLSQRISVTGKDEIGQFGEAFNTMTSQVQELINGLEERVAERTIELKTAKQQSERQVAQFEAISQVARDINTSQYLDSLLPQITNVISQQFNFYHVGIFLLDTDNNFAVLRASNSIGGQKMLKRKHQLKVGENSIVGFVTSQSKPHIALDTGADATFFDNPDLPETRSEIALPLMIDNQVAGALDVQSTEPNAFSQEDISTLTTLADQVSIAIQNSRLHEETRAALAQSQALVQRFTQEGWSNFKRSQSLTGIRRSKAKSTLLKEPFTTDDLNSDSILALPIKLREQKIGTLKLRSPEEHKWSQDEIDIATSIIERAAIAMENARLLEDAQHRAGRESLVAEITTKIRSTNDPQVMIQTALDELKDALGASKIELKTQSLELDERGNVKKN